MRISNKSKRRFFIASGVSFLLVLTVTLIITSVTMYRQGLRKVSEDGAIKLELFVTYLQGVLKAYESLPEMLAIDDNLVNALIDPTQDQRIDKLNRYLETINTISDTADTYLMDKDGLTIAASNWQEERPFVGRNFSFRPYFVEAMRGKLGRYYALGTTSSKRGYYFAYPVRKEGVILGVVVIKINIDSVEQAWGSKEDSFLVTDPDGVVFITTRPGWRYHSLHPLDSDTKFRVIESRRYPNADILELSRVKKQLRANQKLVQIHDRAAAGERAHLLLTRHMPEAGWSVHIMTDTRSIYKNTMWANVIVGSVLFLTYLLLLLLMQRRYRMAELSRMRERARKVLQNANEKLEMRVQERTQELTEMNRLLRREIKDRQRTEATLKKTRNELIHAAKMAVLGQMSASINHELNQPLAAIRSYTDNGKLFLQKGRQKEALWNLEQISELTERMAQIGVQLKLFSRKSKGQMAVVPLHGVVDGALEILRPAIKKSQVNVTVRLTPEDIEVNANNVLLQQVLVNLIGNAVQAVEDVAEKEVSIVANIDAAKVLLKVKDTGVGIPEADRPYIFEPFFTTKKSGQGLGLGLTISERILQGIGAKIDVLDPEAEGGTCFQITLDKA